MGLLGVLAICPSSVVCVTGLDGRVGVEVLPGFHGG